MNLRTFSTVVSLTVVSACGCPHEPGPLVSYDGWTVVDASDDPFTDRLENVDCPPRTGYGAEFLGGEAVFSVDTQNCNYLTAVQPSALDVCPGEELLLRLWHFALNGSGESHVAIAVGGSTIWEERIPIPAEAQAFTPRVPAPEISVGTPVHIHVHNHGSNSYSFIEVSVVED
ncbi:MAG: hypothetical protein RKU31_21730 [Deltaproteobacteria bacterium]